MDTAFDLHVRQSIDRGYYNHRDQNHADVLTAAIVRDVSKTCPALRKDLLTRQVGVWKGVSDGIGRGRRADMLVAVPDRTSPPPKVKKLEDFAIWGAAVEYSRADPDGRRIFGEHKSVMTAHRNKGNRHDDLNNLWQQTNTDPGIIAIATIMVGTAPRYLNVAQGVKPRFYDPVVDDKDKLQFLKSGKVKRKLRKAEWGDMLTRIRKGDSKLEREFWFALSGNGPDEWHKTVDRCRSIPQRPSNNRKQNGYDKVVVVPMAYSNLSTPRVDRKNSLRIDVDAEYAELIQTISSLYKRMHA